LKKKQRDKERNVKKVWSF